MRFHLLLQIMWTLGYYAYLSEEQRQMYQPVEPKFRFMDAATE